ncbi:MAG: hypothetical protein OXN89_06905 [Bryobacterales bacterium]|nr:hypothetical protein [Bryobacterales bacterium]
MSEPPMIVIEYIGEPPEPKGEIRRFTARSASRPGKLHELVVVGPAVRSCSCEAWSFGNRCHHARDLGRFVTDFQEIAHGDPWNPHAYRGGPRRGASSVYAETRVSP